ncbi:vacuolar protein sorting-associated protein 33A [Galendromus occidentalis]|uniref:Vacuolar protein sorting-associated protein 33A n=1 Tax=Galendromus occidentalis TaxID=34638 RepID=A0AAJ6QVQ8_9ACAR|nr:vacuolar protein sorting-associated protein 33A [Galendromus occidentalis]
MVSTGHLSSGRLNLAQIRESYVRDMLNLLDSVGGTKCLIWDEELTSPVATVIEYHILKARGVVYMIQSCKMGMEIATVAQNVIFILRPRSKYMDVVADCIKHTKNVDFHIFFVPRASFPCQQRLEKLGVFGSVQIHQLLIEVFPLDPDLMSMDLDGLFRECYVDGDTSQLLAVARALSMLQSLFGVIPYVRGKGVQAQRILELMARLRKELSGKESPQVAQIDTLFLLDRSVDLLSPLATQLTYEGLLDEMYGIKDSFIKFPAEVIPEEFHVKTPNSSEKKPTTVIFQLNSSEDLYVALRDRNFNTVGPVLNQMAKQLSKQYDERHEAKTISAMKDFVSRLPKIQETKRSLTKHCTLSELVQQRISNPDFTEDLYCEQEFLRGEYGPDQIHPHIENCIALGRPLLRVIRLICMHSLTANGFKPKLMEHYKREVVHQYGIETLTLLKNLEKCGLLKTYVTSQKGYSMMLKTLRLTVDNVNDMEPQDPAFVHQMYAPLSVRLLQFYGTPGWRAITDILEVLPGATIEDYQHAAATKLQRRNSRESLQSGHGSEDKKLCLVVFIGGCTFAEITALRWLSQQGDCSLEFVVLTTSIISGDRFIKTLM